MSEPQARIPEKRLYPGTDETRVTRNGVEQWAHWCNDVNDYINLSMGITCKHCGGWQLPREEIKT